MKEIRKSNCLSCGKDLDGHKFYQYESGAYFYMCKDCCDEINYSNRCELINLLRQLNRPFIEEVYKTSNTLGEYMRKVCSLPQYRGMIFKEDNDNSDNKIFNTTVVDFLKKEESLLREKADKMLNNGDLAMYAKLINAYETVVQLIKKYDWELKYSEYKTDESKQVGIWEQNGDGVIRNHKIWNVN